MKTDDELMSDRLDWIERAAIENMKTHHVCADNLAKDSAATLTLLLIGIGGGLTYAAKALESSSWNWLAVGCTVFTLWLIGVSWVVVIKCLMFVNLPQIFNEPQNLDAPDMTFNELRQSEIDGMQIRITAAAARNRRLTASLNLARKLALVSPIAFIFSSLAAIAVAHFWRVL